MNIHFTKYVRVTWVKRYHVCARFSPKYVSWINAAKPKWQWQYCTHKWPKATDFKHILKHKIDMYVANVRNETISYYIVSELLYISHKLFGERSNSLVNRVNKKVTSIIPFTTKSLHLLLFTYRLLDGRDKVCPTMACPVLIYRSES